MLCNYYLSCWLLMEERRSLRPSTPESICVRQDTRHMCTPPAHIEFSEMELLWKSTSCKTQFFLVLSPESYTHTHQPCFTRIWSTPYNIQFNWFIGFISLKQLDNCHHTPASEHRSTLKISFMKVHGRLLLQAPSLAMINLLSYKFSFLRNFMLNRIVHYTVSCVPLFPLSMVFWGSSWTYHFFIVVCSRAPHFVTHLPGDGHWIISNLQLILLSRYSVDVCLHLSWAMPRSGIARLLCYHFFC